MKIRTKILIVAAVIVVGIVGVVTRASHLQFGSRYTSPQANVATILSQGVTATPTANNSGYVTAI